MIRLRSRALALGLSIAASWPTVALACAVCGGGGDTPRSQAAFFNTTIVLSLLPLGMLGGGLWWLKREGRDFLAGEFEDRDAFPAEGEAASTPTDDGEGQDRA